MAELEFDLDELRAVRQGLVGLFDVVPKAAVFPLHELIVKVEKGIDEEEDAIREAEAMFALDAAERRMEYFRSGLDR